MMNPFLFKSRRNILGGMALLLTGLILIDLITFLLAEGLWFQEVDYFNIFTTRLLTQMGLGLITFCLSLSYLWGNLALARRYSWPHPAKRDRPASSSRDADYTGQVQASQVQAGQVQASQVQSGQMSLRWLLPLTLLLSGWISLFLLHHGKIFVNHWHSDFIPKEGVPAPTRLTLEVLWQQVQQWPHSIWQPLGLLGLAIALLIYPNALLIGITLLISLVFSFIASERWTSLLVALSPTAFHQTDPVFGRELSFYIFSLPWLELVDFWLFGLLSLALVSVILIYLLSGNSLSQGYFAGFSAAQKRHLYRLLGLLLLAAAWSLWLDRYNLLYSAGGASFGASYTSVKVALPSRTLLSILALILGSLCLGRSLLFQRKTQASPIIPSPRPNLVLPSKPGQQYSLLGYLVATYGLTAVIAIYVLPFAVQHLFVQPNELQLERPYIQRTIAMTREAFNLDQVEIETFNPEDTLTYADLQRNALTIENIRLWDKRPLLDTNRQLQRIRSYYEFPDADIDRYPIPDRDGVTSQQQVLIAARELDYRSVPSAAQTWVNQHLIYTHGYGFTVSPVNVVDEGGLPDYFIQGIEPVVVDSRVNNSIPVGKPRIYYGELTNTYVMTQTQVQELDYPSGSENVYNIYDGRGGINIGNFWRRLLFAKHLRDWRMLFTSDFTPQTQLLFRRQIDQRVRAIAPFLHYDSDPYLVVADTGGKTWERGSDRNTSTPSGPDSSYLYWMIDAYTTSDRYPYSEPSRNGLNYMRNSVKILVDAYHGSVNFYSADAQDPLIKTWEKIFPGMFHPLDQMPAILRQHIRYAQTLYQIQSEQLMTYHMVDPTVFYNREDQWRAANEIYADQQQRVEPYFLITKLTVGTDEEFLLLRPFTPIQRNNLIAWLAARSDGQHYGKMLLYVFPKQKLIYGPEQIEARINQDPVISERISLWNRQGSKAIQGNLLVIPIEQSLLYVEPLYLEAEYNQLPTLVRVIVAYGNRIAMTETLDQSLRAIFQPAPTDAPIIRPVDAAPLTVN